ncbi:hypothetical protein V6N11_071391 [Hibiscus sabdariffa]|uniref:Uncharacterized protein n=1 Tax=Hibiscus sabdariffa TaxID=183260 RepID=A0ABR2U0A7_9ROSI
MLNGLGVLWSSTSSFGKDGVVSSLMINMLNERISYPTDNIEASQILTGCSRGLSNHALVLTIRNYLGRATIGVVDALARICRGAPVGVLTFSTSRAERLRLCCETLKN